MCTSLSIFFPYKSYKNCSWNKILYISQVIILNIPSLSLKDLNLKTLFTFTQILHNKSHWNKKYRCISNVKDELDCRAEGIFCPIFFISGLVIAAKKRGKCLWIKVLGYVWFEASSKQLWSCLATKSLKGLAWYWCTHITIDTSDRIMFISPHKISIMVADLSTVWPCLCWMLLKQVVH